MWLNVLVTAASRRVALVQGFRKALQTMQVRGIVGVTDINPLSPALYFADRAWHAPLATDPDYVDRLLEICQEERIGLLVPTIDDELPIVAASRDRFDAIGVKVACSSVRVAEICGDKFATCAYLRDRGISAARSFLPDDLPSGMADPLFVKPRFGRGSVHAYSAHDRRQLDFFLSYVEDPVVQEYLDGPEYTIDVLGDFSGRPLAVVPRERVLIRSGVSDRGRTVRDPKLIDLALECARVLPFIGAANIQCRVVDGAPVVFEINPRFSGGIQLTIAAGADFPRLLLALALEREVAPIVGRFQDDLWMTSYESSVMLRTAQIKTLQSQPGLDTSLEAFGEVA
jgi:carbamoyl-phosphate synthase large subunit